MCGIVFIHSGVAGFLLTQMRNHRVGKLVHRRTGGLAKRKEEGDRDEEEGEISAWRALRLQFTTQMGSECRYF